MIPCLRVFGKSGGVFLAGKFSEPVIEDLELLRGNVDKGDSHSHSRLDVYNFSARLEHSLIPRDAEFERSSFRQRDKDVHVAPFAAELGNATRNASITHRLAELDGGDQGETRHFPFVGIRTARLVRCRV